MTTGALAPLLTPHGRLLVEPAHDAPEIPEALARTLSQSFARGAGHGLLQLGADEAGTALPPLFGYWRELGARYVTAVCTSREAGERGESAPLPPPPREDLEALALAAPPMAGAEYLTAPVLRELWETLDAAFRTELAESKPVRIAGRAIAGTFWGKAWCDNMERYSDFANRLPRGRTYVRNGSVIDLRIAAGKVEAQVAGSDIYKTKTTVTISALPKARWQALGRDCARSIDSLVELLQGRLSRGVMERICRPETRLFPSPKEITFACSCPDWAAMCKHVAAVLYGVGARLDQKLELLFTLREVDASELVARAGEDLPLAKKAPAARRLLGDRGLAEMFGIEMAAAPAPARPGRRGVAKRPRGKR